MAPTGDVGRWIRSLRPAHLARVGDRRVLFTHGDVPESLRDPERLGRALERARRLVRGAMPGTWEDPCLAGDESVFWDRSFLSLAVDPDGDPGAVCRALEVDHVVTGHTPHQRVSVYGDRIFRVDVGMTPAYGENEPEALVFTDEGATALSASGRERSLVRFDAAIAA